MKTFTLMRIQRKQINWPLDIKHRVSAACVKILCFFIANIIVIKSSFYYFQNIIIYVSVLHGAVHYKTREIEVCSGVLYVWHRDTQQIIQSGNMTKMRSCIICLWPLTSEHIFFSLKVSLECHVLYILKHWVKIMIKLCIFYPSL